MTLIEQLQAILRQLEAADAMRIAALGDLAALTASVIDEPGIEQPSQAAGAGANGAAVGSTGPVETAAPSSPREETMREVKETHLCPRCDRAFGSKHAVTIHVSKAHQTKPAPVPSAGERRPAAPKPNGTPGGTGAPGLIPGLGQ